MRGMDENSAYTISLTCERMRESADTLNRIEELLTPSPDPDWPKAQCGECGETADFISLEDDKNERAALPMGDNPILTTGHPFKCDMTYYCREKSCFVRGNCPACPTFVRRPAEGEKCS